jgi:hypothetical protein
LTWCSRSERSTQITNLSHSSEPFGQHFPRLDATGTREGIPSTVPPSTRPTRGNLRHRGAHGQGATWWLRHPVPVTARVVAPSSFRGKTAGQVNQACRLLLVLRRTTHAVGNAWAARCASRDLGQVLHPPLCGSEQNNVMVSAPAHVTLSLARVRGVPEPLARLKDGNLNRKRRRRRQNQTS